MRALILGVAGQDGSYLADLLLERGYAVFGLVRPSNPCTHVDPRVGLYYGDICDAESIASALRACDPTEIYNVAAQSHAGRSVDVPSRTAEINYVATLRLLELLRGMSRPAKLYQAITAEILRPITPNTTWVDETSPTIARNPYGIAKIACWEACKYYRDAYGLFVACGLPFNHESERRPEAFLVRKVTACVARIIKGSQEKLTVGNLNSSRDWGYAPDYCEAFIRMLALDVPNDYVIAANQAYTVRDVIRYAFEGIGIKNWQEHVVTDGAFVRANDYKDLCGCNARAYRDLAWKPTMRFEKMIEHLVKHDLYDNHALYASR